MATITKEESKRGIRLSEMTPELQDRVEKLGIDQDGDGKITMEEMETLIARYLDTKKDNKFLRHLVTVLVIFSILLTGCVFGASITAARLSKDTAVDPVNGIMYAKGSETPIQTEAVAIRNDGVIVNDMNTKELDALNEISLDNGSMKFQVKGYAKSVEKNQVALLVEGGSLIYGQEGLVAATGMAETMFNLVYTDDTVSVDEDEEGVRRLSRRPGRNPRGLASVTDDENEEGVPHTHRLLKFGEVKTETVSKWADKSPKPCEMNRECSRNGLVCYYGNKILARGEKCKDAYAGQCFCG